MDRANIMPNKKFHFSAEGSELIAEIYVDSFQLRGSENEEAKALADNEQMAEDLADWIYDNLLNGTCYAILNRLSANLGM